MAIVADVIEQIAEIQERRLLSDKEAATLIGVGRTKFREMHATGRLGPLPIRFGKCVRWDRKELEAWIDAGCPPRERWLQIKDKV